MKPAVCLLLLSFLSIFAFGQAEFQKRKSIFLEIAGSGGLGSLNYENQFAAKGQANFTWRAGLSFAPIDRNNGVGIVFPVMVNTLIGRTPHKLELGVGQGITLTTKGHFFALGTAAVGYRFQPEGKRLFFRATYTPLISYLVDFQVQQWAGVSIGYTIN